MNGKMIVIEGTDCSGKETQSQLVVQHLQEQGKKAIAISFPMYDTPTGKIVGGPYLGRKEIMASWFEEGAPQLDPRISCLYYAADRAYNIDKIKQYIHEGYYVVVDRYTSSNMAHQGGKIADQEERFHMYQWIDKLEYWLLNLPKPDVTIFLHMPYEYSLQLQKNRPCLDDHEKSKEHLLHAEEAYIELSELYHWSTVQCVRDGEIRSIEEINEEIMSLLNSNK